MDLKDARKKVRLSQEEVASYLGISRPTYIKFEKNPDLMTVDDAKKIASLFKMPVSDIFFINNDS